MNRVRAAAFTSVLITAGTLAVAGTASAGSGDCRDWWTIDDTSRTVFTDSTQAVKFWGHRSCGATTVSQYWSAPYRPDEPGDYTWTSMKASHGKDPGAVAYGYELRRDGSG